MYFRTIINDLFLLDCKPLRIVCLTKTLKWFDIHCICRFSPCQVGMLWEVTDADCDRTTIHILKRFLGAKYAVLESQDCEEPADLLQGAVQTSRSVPRNFLNGAAAVVYGLPLRSLVHSASK